MVDMNKLYISNVNVWAPGLYDDKENWKAWKDGKMEITCVKESPKLEYTDPLFRRRLSQITKMTVHVIHLLLENAKIDSEIKINFISLRGEIEREFTINKSLIEDETILPAGFSLSVFNTPVASATLAFGLKGGYTVILPSKNNFDSALKNALAPVLAGTEKQIMLVYADELVPDCYGEKRPDKNIPLAFSALVSTEPLDENSSTLSLDSIYISPVDFLKDVL